MATQNTNLNVIESNIVKNNADGNTYNYKSKKVQISAKTFYVLMEVVNVETKEIKYVNVRKVMTGRMNVMGKDFNNWDEATKAYKNKALKTEILKFECGL